MTPGWLKATGAGVELRIKVQPRASQNEVTAEIGDELKIRLTAPPVDSAANEAAITFLAEILDVSRASVSLLRGGASRHKVMLIRGLTVEQAARRLGAKHSSLARGLRNDAIYGA